MLNEQTIVLNLVPGEVPPMAHVTQDDVGREIKLVLMDNNKTFNLSSSYTYSLRGTKPTGTGFAYDDAITVSGTNSLTFKTNSVMTAAEGPVRCGIIIYDGDEHVETLNFILRVQRAALSSQDIIDASDFDRIVENAVGDQIETIVNEELSAINERLDNVENAVENVSIDPDDLGLEQDPDTNYVYPTYRGVRSSNGIYIASGGGGGSGNNAVLTITNTTGWLSHTISEGAPCVLSLTWSSLEDGVSTGGGTMTVSVGNSVKLTQNVSQGSVTVDVGSYLTAGSNKVKIKVSDIYDNAKLLNFTITVMSLSISSYFSTSGTFTAGETVTYTYIPVGAVEKTVHFIVDDEQVGTATVTASGTQQSYSLPAMEHGAHTLLVYFTAEIDGETVSSNELYYGLAVVDSSSSLPIITSSFRATTASQYETLQIPYMVYTPNSLTSEVALYTNGSQAASLTVDRTEHIWSYRSDTVGALALTITTGTVIRTFNLTVTESNVDVDAVTDDLALYLSSYGRSNNESDPSVWQDADNDISCTLSGFNFTSDGWVSDSNGNTVLRVAGDARVTIPYKPFANDFRATGKTIELEFATRNVRNYDATVISCMSGGRGFQLTAQNAYLASEQSEIVTQYKEDEHVRISFVTEKRTENRLLFIYINGIMSGVVQYPDDDNFSQSTPVDITIGSDYCATDIYNIRIYDNNLTRRQILNNWIADTQDITTMLARYDHNNIYDAYGSIVIEDLPGDLPYMVISCAELPQYKGDKKTISGYYVDPTNAAKSFSFESAQADVQGTSSQYYPRKNYKIKFNGGFKMTNSGTTESKFAMNADAVPTKTFTFKADVASSEGANNVELARLYNSACPYQTPPQEEDSRIRQGIDGFPIVIFWDNGNSTTFIGKYNFNNDKGTEEVFGFEAGDESWEIKNNTGNRVIWKSADYSGSEWLNDFEGRYPDGNENPTNLAALAAWLVTTDQSAATGNALAASYTDVDGIVHTVDNAAYRLAKFKTEVWDHMERESTLFYYLFTELFLMVDSRAKNAFPSFLGGDKWCWLPYDFDTAIGINNEGALVFSYNLEDTDTTAGGANVYNGQDSVLWVNLRQAFFNDLKSMYQTLRSQGKLSYTLVENMFETHQAKWPEAIFNDDAWFKYIDPLVNDGTGAYLDMAQGSKAEQRKWWLYNRFRYIDSKYNAGDALTDVITIRAYSKDDITVTPYADIYPAVKYGSYLVSTRGTRNVATTLANPLDDLNDTEVYVYSASQLASIGDLSGLKVGLLDLSHATKLQTLKVGDSSSSYDNANMYTLTLGNNTLLETIDARNCSGLGNTALEGHTQTAVDISGCVNIEHAYFSGTNIRSLILPNGGVLKTLQLPNTITNLTARNQSGITSFSVDNDDYSNITTLRIENCGDAIPVLDILEEMAANSRVRIIGLNETVTTTDDVDAIYDKLDTMLGLDENGNNVDKAVVSGTISLTDAVSDGWYDEATARYPNVSIVATVIPYLKNYIERTMTDYSSPDVTSLRTNAFGYCTQLTTVDLGAVETINPNAFQQCTALTTLYLGSDTVPTLTNVSAFNGTPFADGGAGGTIYISSDLYAHLGDESEHDYKSATNWSTLDGYGTITWAEIPSDHTTQDLRSSMLDSIVDGSVTAVEFNGIVSIGNRAFSNSTALTSASFPNATSVGTYAFNNCTALTSASFPNTINVGEYAFNGCPLTSLILPNATSLSRRAINNCEALKSLYLPRVRTLSGAGGSTDSPFYGSGGVNSILVLPSLRSTSSGAFRGSSYYNVDIGQNYSSIASYNFYLSPTISKLILRKKSSIVTADASNSIRYVTSNSKVYVPSALIDSYKAATNWSEKGDIFYAIEGSEYEHYYANGVGVFQDVTRTLTNVTSSHAADDDIVSYGDSYRTILTPDEGMTITSVEVTMSETDITSTAYDSVMGVVTIDEVTGPITIMAIAE